MNYIYQLYDIIIEKCNDFKKYLVQRYNNINFLIVNREIELIADIINKMKQTH